MKNPLNYQISEYDCGPTSFYNILSFLMTREEILPIYIKKIMKYSMTKGCGGIDGTSTDSIRFLCNYFSNFSFPLKFNYATNLSKDDIYLCLDNAGCVLCRTQIDGYPHYVIITLYDNVYFYIWDPYYKNNVVDSCIKLDLSHPFKYNRVVFKDRVFSKSNYDYACGKSCEFVYVNRK